jgi:hypothetical protein
MSAQPRSSVPPRSVRPAAPRRAAVALAALGLAALAAWLGLPALRGWLEANTGERALLPQLRAAGQLAVAALRPPLDTRPQAAINHVPANRFGVNTFLQLEADPAARERSLQMIRDAGFGWIRQEFGWYDLEVAGKGLYTDTRQSPPISAWIKYDHIVDLAEQVDVAIIARLGAPPDWTRADGQARGAFGPPDHYEDFGDFVYTLVSRYRGRVRYWQIWNEPNLAPEWGGAPSPEEYARLLCLAYRRAKEADPEAVILMAALAPTVELGAPWGDEGTNLNDLIYLQRLYEAGAGPCFDIASIQGYGLFSGPRDHRTSPLTIGVNRHVLMRDILVRHGDEAKPIWISELNWNAVPDHVPDRRFGQVTEAEQAAYVVETFRRAEAEWPWVGVINVWFFKRPDTSERDQAWYYFRLVEPDFTPLPVYEAIRALRYQRGP